MPKVILVFVIPKIEAVQVWNWLFDCKMAVYYAVCTDIEFVYCVHLKVLRTYLDSVKTKTPLDFARLVSMFRNIFARRFQVVFKTTKTVLQTLGTLAAKFSYRLLFHLLLGVFSHL